jgi:hypothetical protein
MIYSKEEFESLVPLHDVIVEIEKVFRDEVGGLKIIDNGNARVQFATHKGKVVKEPINKEFKAETSGMMRFGTTYDIKIGDTVYFGFDVINITKDVTSPKYIEVKDEVKEYIAMDYRELILRERDGDMVGLNGFCAGYHPKKEGLFSSIIYLPQENYEKEVVDAVSGRMKEFDRSNLDKERLVVVAAPVSYPEWGYNELIHVTEVNVGDIVMFPPNSFAVPLSNKLVDGYELFAVNTREICAYDAKD